MVRTTITTIKERRSSKRKKKASNKRPKKKHVKKKAKRVMKISHESVSDSTKKICDSLEKRDKLLIENFVGLQKAMATLSVRFSDLSQNISNLLNIFEQAARVLAESEKQVDKTLTTKLDALIEQNKNLSREIGMVDSKMRRAPLKSSSPSLYSRQISSPQPSLSSAGIPPKQLPQP